MLKPTLRGGVGDQSIFGYEEWVRNWEHQTIWRLLSFGIPLLLLFTAAR